MVGWHHQLNGHEFEQILGESEGQGSLECCSSCGCKETDIATEQQQVCVCACMYIYIYIFFFRFFFPYRLLQNIK